MSEIFNIVHLDNKGIKNKYIFSIQKFNNNSSNSSYIKENIYYDDSILQIKEKIAREIGNDNIFPENIYLFCQVKKIINLQKTYEQFLQKKTNTQFNDKLLNVLFSNIKKNNINDNDYKWLWKGKISDNIDYYDIDKKWKPSKSEKLIQNISLGQKVLFSKNYPYTVNPNDIKNVDPVLLNANNNKFITEDNILLFEYGKIYNNTLYFYTPDDIVKLNKNIDVMYLLKVYFPKLYENDIINISTYDKNIQKLAKKFNKSTNKTNYNNYNKCVNFYYSNYEKNAFTSYVIDFNIVIHPITKIKLPLDAIFKMLNSNKNMPLIKYNPRDGTDTVYRLFTKNYYSNEGKKLPSLYVENNSKNYKIKKIMNLLTSTNKTKMKTIGFYIDYNELELYCQLYENGNFEIKTYNEIYKNLNEIENILSSTINILIDKINILLKKSGYNFNKFEKLDDENVEIVSLNYAIVFDYYNKQYDLKEFAHCLSPIFLLSDNTKFEDLNDEIIMYYKRVSSYKKMEGINFVINTLKQNNQSDSYIISYLINNHNKTLDDATDMVTKWNQNIEFKTDIYVNNKIKIGNHPGFECSLYIGKVKDSYQPKNIIKIMNINNINYIKYIDIYIYSLIKTFILQEKNWNWTLENCKTNKLIEKLIVDDKNIKQDDLTPSITLLESNDKSLEKLDGNQKKKILYVDDNINEVENEDEERTLQDSINDEEIMDFANMDVDDPFGLDDDLEMTFSGGGKKERKILKTNFKKIELSGQKNYWADRIKNVFPEYAGKSENKDWRSYAKVCQSQYKRVPVLINDEEKKLIDQLDGNKNKSYDEYITTKKNGKDYHFICPRFWCIRDPNTGKGRSLSIEQVNKGECGGWDAVIPQNAKKVPEGKNIYEFTDTLKHRDGVKDSNNKLVYRPHYPKFMKKNTHPDGLCIPCCYTKPNTFGDKYKKIDDNTYIEIGKPNKKYTRTQMEDKKILLDNFSLQIPESGKYNQKIPNYNDFEAKHVFKNGKINKLDLNINNYPKEFHRSRSNPRKDINRYMQCNKNNVTGNNEINNSENKKLNKKLNIHNKPLLDTFPLPEHKFGYLNISMQTFLNFNNESKCYIRRNDDNLKNKNKCLLRYGVNGNNNNSFISCIGHLMKYKKMITVDNSNYNDNIVDVNNVIKHIINKLTLDKFISCNKGNLYHSFFNPKILFKEKAKEYLNKLTNNEKKLKKIIGLSAYEKVFSAREQFFNYLLDPNSIINHTFLWDLICSPTIEYGLFFKNGINLVIFNSPDNDITKKIEILCPTYNVTNNIFDSNKNTIMIYCENGIYEPIYIVEKNNKQHNIWKHFNHSFLKNDKSLQEIYKFMIIIKNNTFLCKEQPSNKEYSINWHSNINFIELIQQLNIKNKKKIKQIINHYYQTIGIIYNYNKTNIYIPCKPSNINFNYDFEYIGEKFYGLNYDDTIDTLNKLNIIIDRKNNIKLEIKKIIVQDELVVALLTNTNQTILINPIKYNNSKFKKYSVVKEEWKEKADKYNYIDHKIKINQNKGIDDNRINEIRKIKLENNFYNIYRNIFRININNKIYENEKNDIIYITENNIDKDNKLMDYNTKINKIKKIIKSIIKKNVEFITFDKNIDINQIVLCLDLNKKNCSSPFCSFNEKNTCKQLLPKKNYIDDSLLNENLYLHRLSDELIRYQKIKNYIFTNNIYLSFNNIEYNINKNEIVILENILKEEYDKNIKIVPENLYLYNKNLFDNTNPETSDMIPIKNIKQQNIISQKYSDLNINTIEEEEEEEEEEEIIKLAEDVAEQQERIATDIVKVVKKSNNKKPNNKKPNNKKNEDKYCRYKFFIILLKHIKNNPKNITKSIKELLSFIKKNIQDKKYTSEKWSGKLNLWSSGDPAHYARREFGKLIYDKFWEGTKGELLTEEKIKDKISNINIEGISKDNIFIEYIAYSKKKLPLKDGHSISCTKKEKALRMTIIPYLKPFGNDLDFLNINNLIPSKTTHPSSKKFLEHWEEFNKEYK